MAKNKFNYLKKIFNILICAFVLTSTAQAQQDVQFTQYMFNGMFLNPGYAGMQGQPVANLLYRVQWLGYEPNAGYGGSAPRTQMFSFHMPFTSIRSGAGLHVMNEELGPLRNFEVQGSFSKHFEIGPGKLGIGARLGVFNQSINGEWRATQPDDPTIPATGTAANDMKFDRAVGAWYQTDKWYVGATLNHLRKFTYDTTNNFEVNLKNHLFVTAGYKFKINENFDVLASTLVKTDFISKGLSFDVSALGFYQNKYWAGAAFRRGDSFSLLLGLSMLKNNSLKFGYAIDLTAFGNNAKTSTSHEVMLIYMLPPLTPKPKPVIRNPRYRF